MWIYFCGWKNKENFVETNFRGFAKKIVKSVIINLFAYGNCS